MNRLLLSTTLTGLLAFPATVGAATVSLTANATMQTKQRDGLTVVQKGRITTNKLGAGRITQRAVLSRGSLRSRFTVRLKGGKIRGRARGKVSVGLSLSYSGKARITGGSGRFAGASGTGLRFSGSAPLSGASSRLSLRGTVSY